MSDANSVLTALESVRGRADGSFAIVTADAARNYYAQFVGNGKHGLLAEVVGNAYLDPADRLPAVRQAQLRARGWAGDGEANWTKTWADVSTPEALQRVAVDALGALREVYGAAGELRVALNLGGPGGADAVEELGARGVEPASGRMQPKMVVLFAVLALLVVYLLLR